MILLRPLVFVLFSLLAIGCGGRVAAEPVTVEDRTVATTGVAVTNWWAGQTHVSLQTTSPRGTKLRVVASLENDPSGTYELRPVQVGAKTVGLASATMTCEGPAETWTADSGTVRLDVTGGWRLHVHVDALFVPEDGSPRVVHLVTDTTVSLGTT